jgi:hypothetical protein
MLESLPKFSEQESTQDAFLCVGVYLCAFLSISLSFEILELLKSEMTRPRSWEGLN